MKTFTAAMHQIQISQGIFVFVGMDHCFGCAKIKKFTGIERV
jgi:hypothetical protein